MNTLSECVFVWLFELFLSFQLERNMKFMRVKEMYERVGINSQYRVFVYRLICSNRCASDFAIRFDIDNV